MLERCFGRVEDGRGSLGHSATLRFPYPLIEPCVPISGIRLSDWLHREVHGETNRTRLRHGEELSFTPRHSNLPAAAVIDGVWRGSSPITFTPPSSKAHQKSGPFPQPALPGFNGHPTPAMAPVTRPNRSSATRSITTLWVESSSTSDPRLRSAVS